MLELDDEVDYDVESTMLRILFIRPCINAHRFVLKIVRPVEVNVVLHL